MAGRIWCNTTTSQHTTQAPATVISRRRLSARLVPCRPWLRAPWQAAIPALRPSLRLRPTDPTRGQPNHPSMRHLPCHLPCRLPCRLRLLPTSTTIPSLADLRLYVIFLQVLACDTLFRLLLYLFFLSRILVFSIMNRNVRWQNQSFLTYRRYLRPGWYWIRWYFLAVR